MVLLALPGGLRAVLAALWNVLRAVAGFLASLARAVKVLAGRERIKYWRPSRASMSVEAGNGRPLHRIRQRALGKLCRLWGFSMIVLVLSGLGRLLGPWGRHRGPWPVPRTLHPWPGDRGLHPVRYRRAPPPAAAGPGSRGRMVGAVQDAGPRFPGHPFTPLWGHGQYERNPTGA